MTTPRAHEVRRHSVRVALAATALVGAACLVVAVTVVAYVTGSLTSQVDQRLAGYLEHFSEAPWPVGGLPERPGGDRPLGPQRAFWGIKPDGQVLSDAEDLPLPVEFQGITDPNTVTINGVEIRIMGKASGVNHIVVGESLEPVNDARATVILGELLIAPILLIAVFLGAVAIGRRVATPIELARRRQLEFTADASHELRTPLSVIEAHTSLALTQDRSAEWYRNAFGQVDRESRRMHRLIDDLLWLARFDATKAPPPSEPVDLGVLAGLGTERFAAIAEARGLRLSVDAGDAGAIVAVPAEWLDRLLGVLIDNACKYSPDGGAVDVTVSIEGQRVRLTIDDSGPGIPETERGRIFDRFHRATSGSEGAGLGLAIADAVVRATGGRWLVASSPSGGARVGVSWPRWSAGGREPSGARTVPRSVARQ
jgi:signal transduction histidine kinase